jgi:hypothetical protein
MKTAFGVIAAEDAPARRGLPPAPGGMGREGLILSGITVGDALCSMPA